MTDLQTKTALMSDVRVDLPFVVNEFQRVHVPPRKPVDSKEFRKLSTAQKQALMERLIDHVKEI
jgi:hypothetical protein